MKQGIKMLNEKRNPFENVTGHPDYVWKRIKPVSFADLEETIQFVSMRVFSKDQKGMLTNFRNELDTVIDRLGLGRVLWLRYNALHARNSNEFLHYCAKKRCFIFDVWEYGMAFDKAHCLDGDIPEDHQPSQARYQQLLKISGRRFLGYDIGEQDSRYNFIYAPLQCPLSRDRKIQYLNFYRHFDRMRDELHEHVCVLVGTSLTHYLAKEGGTTLIGAEAIQHHMNTNLWHSFVRGAGKQYGVIWFGNASIFNFFGFRDFCDDRINRFGKEVGRHSGPSDDMLRNTFYALFVYNCAILGFEAFIAEPPERAKLSGAVGEVQREVGTKLTGLGQVQREVMKLACDRRNLKKLHTPVAVLTDFYQGWVQPRWCTQNETHRVWGGLPYSQGDFQLAALFELFYPGYMDSSAFRNERGYLASTPYGDILDVILSDCRPEVMDHYDLIILAGDLKIDAELAYKLHRFAMNGGTVVLSANVPGAERLMGKRVTGRQEHGVAHRIGKGRLLCLSIPYMLGEKRVDRYVNRVESSCPLLYDLHPLARKTIAREIEKVMGLRIQGECMATLSFNEGDREGLVLLVNGTPKEQTVAVQTMNRAKAWDTVRDEGAKITAGKNTALTVTLRAGGMLLTRPHARSPWARRRAVSWSSPLPFKLAIRINRSLPDLAEAVLRLPSFRNYFDGLILGPRQLMAMDGAALKSAGRVMERRGIQVLGCDVTPVINQYPDLTILGGGKSTPAEALAYLRGLLEKMAVLGSKHLILPSSKNTELACKDHEAIQRIKKFFRQASQLCQKHGVQLHLKPSPHRFFDSYAAMTQAMTSLRLKGCGLWFDLAHCLIMQTYNSSIKHGYPKYFPDPRQPGVTEIKNCFPNDYQFVRERRDQGTAADVFGRYQRNITFVALSSPGKDCFGNPLDTHDWIKGAPYERDIRRFLGGADLKGKTVVLDFDADLLADYDRYFEEWAFLTNPETATG